MNFLGIKSLDCIILINLFVDNMKFKIIYCSKLNFRVIKLIKLLIPNNIDLIPSSKQKFPLYLKYD